MGHKWVSVWINGNTDSDTHADFYTCPNDNAESDSSAYYHTQSNANARTVPLYGSELHRNALAFSRYTMGTGWLYTG